MRWQKLARLAIAVFVIGFAGFVFLAMRQRVAPPSGGGDVTRADPAAILESGAGDRKSFKFGKRDSTVKWEKALTYKDGKSKLVGVTLELPDRNGRTFVVTCDEAEVVTPPDKADQPSVAKCSGHVKLRTDNGVELLANEATFNDADGKVEAPGPGHVHTRTDEGHGYRCNL